ncbi:MAG: glycosyltransferase [Sedimentisphaerales bacterium]|nr:glycosyltransferase [Sedimentisphaerales bacterium]
MECKTETPPLLSIVIPTRNRAKYAGPTIESILGLSKEPLELVIHDNSDNDELEEYVSQRKYDPRLKYFRIKGLISGTENFELSAAKAQGEFMGFIGDADCINPELFQVVAAANTAGLDAVLGSSASYIWPDVRSRVFGYRLASTLEVKPYSGKISYLDAGEQVVKCLKRGGLDLCSLPLIYHGVVRRQCLEKVRKEAGCYFPGPCPDMAGAVAVSAFVGRYCKVDYPLFISGHGAGATPASGVIMRKGTGLLEEFPHLPQRYKDAWSTIVPKYFSGRTVWAENAVQALKATKREDLLGMLNLPKLHARCMVYEPAFYSLIVRNFFRSTPPGAASKVTATMAFSWYYLATWLLRARFLVKNAAAASKVPSLGFNKTVRIHNLRDTFEATEALIKLLQTGAGAPRML